jgi:hypothetical protein
VTSVGVVSSVGAGSCQGTAVGIGSALSRSASVSVRSTPAGYSVRPDFRS